MLIESIKLSEEGMLEAFWSFDPMIRAFIKHLTHEVDRGRRHFQENWCTEVNRVIHNVFRELVLVLAHEWVPIRQQLVNHNSAGPHIDGLPIRV